MIRKLFIIIITILISLPVFSQELNCRVQVNAQKIQGTNKQVFETMQKAVYEFMNNTKWTPNVFAFDERIECTIQFNLTEQVSTDRYKGTVQIQSNRPVYNTSYNSVLLNFRDNDIEFPYVEFQSLDFNENTFTDNLTSILAYYAYLIIGYDYDTYSESGGTPFFEIAQKIVTNAQNSGVTGWKAFENKRNRYWIVENLLNSKYEECRSFMYKYHRSGMDIMESKPTEGRQEIAEDLKLLQKVFRDKPDPQLSYLKLIFDAKSDEFVNIFSEGFPDEKNRVYNILKEINPTNLTKYEKIKKPAVGI
jgi:hypothetical protein